jgi:hypothetical protein
MSKYQTLDTLKGNKTLNVHEYFKKDGKNSKKQNDIGVVNKQQ